MATENDIKIRAYFRVQTGARQKQKRGPWQLQEPWT